MHAESFELPPTGRSVRALVLLACGLVTGVVLAAVGVLGGNSSGLPPDAIAVVNGRPISRIAYERLVAGLAEDKRGPVTPEDRSRVLDRLIEEELLIGRAVDLDLVRNEPRVRGDLAGAMISTAVAQANIAEPSDDDLARFLSDNERVFAAPSQLRVRRLFIAAQPLRSAAEAEERARAATERLRAREPFAAVETALGDAPAAALPDALLTPLELRRYLGPTAATTALGMHVSEVSEPVRSAAGYEVLQLLQRSAADTPAIEGDSVVRSEWRRRAEEEALRSYLDELRARATIIVSPSL